MNNKKTADNKPAVDNPDISYKIISKKADLLLLSFNNIELTNKQQQQHSILRNLLKIVYIHYTTNCMKLIYIFKYYKQFCIKV